MVAFVTWAFRLLASCGRTIRFDPPSGHVCSPYRFAALPVGARWPLYSIPDFSTCLLFCPSAVIRQAHLSEHPSEPRCV